MALNPEEERKEDSYQSTVDRDNFTTLNFNLSTSFVSSQLTTITVYLPLPRRFFLL